MRLLLAVFLAIADAVAGVYLTVLPVVLYVHHNPGDDGIAMLAGFMIYYSPPLGVLLGATTGCALPYFKVKEARDPIALLFVMVGIVATLYALTLCGMSGTLCFLPSMIWALALMVYGFYSVLGRKAQA